MYWSAAWTAARLCRDPTVDCLPGLRRPLDAVVDTSVRSTGRSFGEGLSPALAQSGVWRYRQLLPPIPDEYIVTRAEGRTPIYWDDRIAHYAGLGRWGSSTRARIRPRRSRIAA